MMLCRFWCWLRNRHDWERLNDHVFCTHCWMEWNPDRGVLL